MDQKDLEALVAALAPIIKEFVRDQLATVKAALDTSQGRIQQLEARAESIAEVADQNRLLDLPRLLAVDELEQRTAALEGRAAATPDQLLPLVDAAVDAAVGAAVAALPKAVDGQDGKDGLDGAPGPTPGQILEMVVGAVGVAVAALPKAVDGKDGADGVGLAGALQDADGHLVVTLSNGQVNKLGVVKGQDGKDGADGRDGFGFDSLTAKHDGAREFTLVFTRGDEIREFKFTMPLMIYRGIWDPAWVGGYAKGDVVTRQGSTWVAVEDTAPGETPGDVASKNWQLAVKRGQNGKDGQMKAVPETVPVQVG